VVKIGIDATSVWGLDDGLLNGMILYTVHLTRDLISTDSENTYFVYCRGKLPSVFEHHGSNAHFIELPSKNRKFLMQWTLPRAARRDGVDVMFYPYNSGALFSGVPSVVTIHDLHPFVIRERFEKIHNVEKKGETLSAAFNRVYWKQMLRQSCARSTRVIAVSETTKSDIVRVFGTPADKVDVVHEAADKQRFNEDSDGVDRAAFIAKHGLPNRYVLVVGTHAYKNIEGVIAAFKLAKRDGLGSIGLVIAGNKAWLGGDVLKLATESALADDIVLTGFFPDADLKYLYQFAELFLFPSFYEGFGLPILEAFSCGTPVITSDRGAMPEVAGEAAVLVDPNDHRQIADKIRDVISDQHLQNDMSRAGLKRASQFSWERAARETRESLLEAATAD
jgi:glycosyltransferase involved in cell wall biosynthesis